MKNQADIDKLPHLLKEFRKSKNLNVLEFAEKYKLSKDNVYKWEKGTKPTKYEDLKKLESILFWQHPVPTDI